MNETVPGRPSKIEMSVVVPAYNAASTLGAQLEALSGQQWDGEWEVVVADNGSTDGTAAVATSFTERDRRFRLIDAGARRGASFARNLGIASATGPMIAFCDADDVVGEGWLAAMGDGLRMAPFVTGPQEYQTLNEPWLHGAFGTRTANALQMFGGIFPFGPTANLGMRRELLDHVGGFDESVSPHEDIEICLRVWVHGVNLLFLPEVVVHYRYRATLGGLWRQAVSYGQATPDIARRLADYGKPTPSRWLGARNWLWLARKLHTVRFPAGRARWIVVAGGAWGRLAGGIRVRRLML